MTTADRPDIQTLIEGDDTQALEAWAAHSPAADVAEALEALDPGDRATSLDGMFRGSLKHRLTWGRLRVVSRPIARRAPRESSRRRSSKRRRDAEGATAPETLRHPDRGGMALWRAGVALRDAPPKG
jgi:hypothetical protein